LISRACSSSCPATFSGVPLTLWLPYSFPPKKNQPPAAVSNGFCHPLSVSNLPQLPQLVQLPPNQQPTIARWHFTESLYTDPFTLQYVAGHDNIETTMRYVHPREAAVHKLFARLADLQRPEDRIACNKSVQNPVQSEMP
jgi:hypothetical protein